jgi:UDP-glucose 4-epimerase
MATSTRDAAASAVVTGAAGFIGSHLVARLAERGYAVSGIDDERTGDWSRVAPGCTRHAADLAALTESEFDDVLGGADVCFHLAAEKHNSSRDAPERVVDVNISATRRLFEAAVRARVRKIVFTSSLYAYGSLGPDAMRESDLPAPTTVYGVSKLAGEHLLRVAAAESSSGWSVARLFFVYGPRQYAAGGYKSVIVANFERLARGERPLVFGDGKQALDYVFVDDVVDALLALADPAHDGLVCNVGSGRTVSVNDLTEAMLEVAGCDLEPIWAPPDWTAGSRRVADVALARDALGWSATTALHDGLSRVWQSMVESGRG